MAFADLHIHSIYSHDGTSSIPAILKYVADQTDLKVIAITDHDTTRGVFEAMHLAPRYGIEVIPGCEVSTADGHLLTLFITETIPAGRSLVESVRRAGELGGVCIAPHPEAQGTSSLNRETLWKALADPQIAQVLVGVETFNGGLVYTRSNQAALEITHSLDIASVGNSDSHILQTIGQGATEFEGQSSLDLRQALENHTTLARMGNGLRGAQVIQHWLPKYLLRRLGWVTWNANPEQPIRYVRMKRALSQSTMSNM